MDLGMDMYLWESICEHLDASNLLQCVRTGAPLANPASQSLHRLLQNEEHLGDCLVAMARKGDVQAVEWLLEHVKVDQIHWSRICDACMGAAENGHIEVCETLYEHGHEEISSMYMGAGRSGQRALCEWVQNRYGGDMGDINTIMYGAAQRGHLELCVYAREKGARDYRAMLRYAAEAGSLEVCQQAITWLEESLVPDEDDGDLYFGYNYNELLYIAARHGSVAICELAMSLGANDYNGMLVEAAGGGQVDICHLARAKGASYFEMMLHSACVHEQKATCLLAIEWGADPNRYDWVNRFMSRM